MRNQFQDIIPPDKRSIRNIPLPKKMHEGKDSISPSKSLRIKKIPKGPSEDEILLHEKEEERELEKGQEEFVYGAGRRTAKPKASLWILTIVVVIALFFTIAGLFKSADVVVVEKSLPVSLSGSSSFSLTPEAGASGYSSITITDSAEALVPATGEKQVSNKASGTVIIYNNAITTSQTLVAGTRLETPAGLIFRIDKTVVVPGMTKSGSKIVAGSIEVAVTADKPGADYNIALSDFTIPGFKGTAKYSGFYGRSKAAMTGGNVGMVATLDESALSATVSDLKAKLEASVKEKALKQLPATQKTFESFSKITYTVSDPKLQGEGEKVALVKVDASAKVYALDVDSFARRLLAKEGTVASGTESFSMDFTAVKVALENEASGTLSASFDGEALVIWDLDIEAFKQAIAGKPVGEISAIAAAFEEIDQVSVTIKPFSLWSPKLPNDTDKISISVKSKE